MGESRLESMGHVHSTTEAVTPLYRKLDDSLLRGAWLVGDCRFCARAERGQAVWSVGGSSTRRSRIRRSRRPQGHRRLR